MTCETRHLPPARAFTLVELMISIALVLVIILGVNAIFKMASDTVNAGQALSGANRDNRAIQSVIYQDFQSAVETGDASAPTRDEREETVTGRRVAER